MSLIEEGPERKVRMANLAIAGSHAVNGVAALHSELVKTRLVPDFYELWPEKFQNKTNGVTHRRWLAYANPGLAGLISSAIGDGWIRDFSQIRKLEAYAGDAAFQAEFHAVKQANKSRLAAVVRATTGVVVDPESRFDVQVKRLHQYKRQLLNVLQIVDRYFSIVEDGESLPGPVTYLFAGKAAPGYHAAKLIIKLINSVASVVNRDPRVNGQMRVAFLPDYRVSLAEKIIPAANVSEQISTAGTEASGTGNMKLAMNGALTVGTLDGANVEILEEVGRREHLRVRAPHGGGAGAARRRKLRPRAALPRKPEVRPRARKHLQRLLLAGRTRSVSRTSRTKSRRRTIPTCISPTSNLILRPSARSPSDYTDRAGWTRKAILNVARMGKFSSDRTVTEYANEIWGMKPIPPA